MTLLQAIWWISILMAVLAVLIMAVLIVRRLIIQRRQVWWKNRKTKLSSVVFNHMENPDSITSIKGDLSDKDMGLIQEIVRELMGTVSGTMKANLLKLLTLVGGLESAITAVNSSNERQRFNAIDTLVLFNNQQSIDTLIRVLDDPYPRIRLAAAGALVKMGAHIPVHQLIEKLGVNSGIRPRLLREVFRQIAPRSVPEILEILKTNDQESVHELLIDALGAANDYSAVDVLVAEMASSKLNIRAEVMRSLAAIGHPSALPAVLKGLKDDAWEVRTQAAICAGRIGLPEVMPNLIQLLDDDRWWVRFRSAGALKKFGPEGLNKLKEISVGSSPAAKIASLVLSEGKPV